MSEAFKQLDDERAPVVISPRLTLIAGGAGEAALAATEVEYVHQPYDKYPDDAVVGAAYLGLE